MNVLKCIKGLMIFGILLNVPQVVNGQIESSIQDYKPVFTILYSEKDPHLAMRSAGIPDVKYNVVTWKTLPGRLSDLPETKKDKATAGDGFDDRILEAKSTGRTVDHTNAANVIQLVGKVIEERGDTVFYEFPVRKEVHLTAYLVKTNQPYPLLHYEFSAKKAGWYSVGYTGAPAYNIEDIDEIWQPLVWQEKRFPDKPYLTLAFRSPLPSALVTKNGTTIGVLAKSSEFPFMPLPKLDNSRFGISVRNHAGAAQPQLWAPVLGGVNSKMETGQSFGFDCLLPVIEKPLTTSYEEIARNAYGFESYRSNSISNLNDVIERMTDYAMSDYAWFIDSLKGFAYSTDVPGAVKNVSSLNPLNISVVMDDAKIFDERGYPIMEYILSREKFLFSLDKEQKIQNPSRDMTGPVAPISELAALHRVLGNNHNFLLDLAEKEFNSDRIRNLDVPERGDTWMNAVSMFKATGESKYLEQAKEGADKYLKDRVYTRQEQFDDPFGAGAFFWTGYTNRWIDLLELYELTGEKRYLDAAEDGARHYAQFIWMGPEIPDQNILVNKDGIAPMYWYLKNKGHKQMYAPEEKVPAWRLAEIGLTPESSGTSSGHRAIFMANYAPWMLRLGYYTDDAFLQEIAKNAVVGRYRNFPGYHINTARTTIYEKADYPLREHKDLSVNSFHYNHIMPMISMLLDYLVTDAFVKSGGQIDFPSELIEGYAYLQSKMYGHQKGSFYGVEGVQLWMPKDLITIDNVELNYLSARKGDQLFVAFMNQSNKDVSARISFNRDLVSFNEKGDYNKAVSVPAGGIKTIVFDDVKTNVSFQNMLNTKAELKGSHYQDIPIGNAKAMLFEFGDYGSRAYIYLSDDDDDVKSTKLSYLDEEGNTKDLVDTAYPFEFTIPLSAKASGISFRLTVVDKDDKAAKSGTITLGEL